MSEPQAKRMFWTTTGNFEFRNNVNNYSVGKMTIEDMGGSKKLGHPGWTEHITTTKNTGEPFSLSALTVGSSWGGQAQITIKGYSKGSSTVKVINVAPNAAGTRVSPNWDGLLKVKIKGPQGNCIDDVVLKT